MPTIFCRHMYEALSLVLLFAAYPSIPDPPTQWSLILVKDSATSLHYSTDAERRLGFFWLLAWLLFERCCCPLCSLLFVLRSVPPCSLILYELPGDAFSLASEVQAEPCYLQLQMKIKAMISAWVISFSLLSSARSEILSEFE